MKSVIKIFCAFSTVLLIFNSLLLPRVSRANELNELNNQIQAKRKEQEATLKKIKEIESKIQNLSRNTSNLNKLLKELQNQQVDLNKQVELLDVQISQQDKNLEEYTKKLAEKEENVRQKINYLYKLSYSQPSLVFSTIDNIDSFFSQRAQVNASIDILKSEVIDFYQKINLANELKEQSKKDREMALNTVNELNKQISEISQRIAANNAAIDAENRSKSGLLEKSNEIASQLKFLTARQQELLKAELEKMNRDRQVARKTLEPGQYYFMGRGRDLIEGHGLGMSQWGAYGMALKGWTYEQILTFYYPGVTIGNYTEPERIIVVDRESSYPPEARARGYLTIDEYLAGLGEVPNSWPSEAIKAQIVAARTYVMARCKNQTSCSICGDARCQVYNGVTNEDPNGLGKIKHVKATKGKVILHNGVPIHAFYSASHRGCSSKLSAVWGVKDLDYIQSVNDDPYTFKDYSSPNPYNPSERIKTYNWQWRTNGYTLDQLKIIFSHKKNPNEPNPLDVGDIQDISVERDNCGRVAKITLKGSLGQKTFTGWNFRNHFNTYTPFNDYIYSTEFGFYQYQP